jgi:hypothetical protein
MLTSDTCNCPSLFPSSLLKNPSYANVNNATHCIACLCKGGTRKKQQKERVSGAAIDTEKLNSTLRKIK